MYGMNVCLPQPYGMNAWDECLPAPLASLNIYLDVTQRVWLSMSEMRRHRHWQRYFLHGCCRVFFSLSMTSFQDSIVGSRFVVSSSLP